MQKHKIESLLGFAVKAGKVLYGADQLETAKTRYYAIVLCASASENTRNKVLRTAQVRHVAVLLAQPTLENTVGRKNCKVLAVTDKQMAQAICGYSDERYRLFSSEGK